MSQHPFERVPEPLRAALERRGFDELTAVQQAALEACGRTSDLQISSMTGSGKTVALGLVAAPSLLDQEVDPRDRPGPTVLVIVPTRELAMQVRTELSWLYAGARHVTFDCVTGGTSTWQERGRLQRTRPRVLVGTPGRLLDHLRSGALSLQGVEHLVLDEADQMLDMGFREELEAILESTPEERRTHMVSATFPPGILRLAERYQRDPVHVEGTRLGEANSNIEHIACMVRPHQRYAALVNLLLVSGEERTLLFVNTRAETAEVAERLSKDGFAALPLSGELAQAQRSRTLASFRSGAVSILVATDVASRGLDVPEVATVIHSAPPMDSEVYTHRSGRTGRAGKQGRSISMVFPAHERRMRRLFSEASVEADWRPVPSAEDVRRVVEKRARRATWEALENAPDPSEERLAEARRLLEEREPEEVVAKLIEATRSSDRVEPLDVQEAPQRREPREFGGAPAARPGKRDRRDVLRPFPPHGQGGHESKSFTKRPLRPGPVDEQATRFHINWGTADGATTRRVLAHVCRRGGVSGRQVGAIRTAERFSTFDILGDAAVEFERRVQNRDDRDPHLRIRRFVPKPGGGERYARHGGGDGGGGWKPRPSGHGGHGGRGPRRAFGR